MEKLILTIKKETETQKEELNSLDETIELISEYVDGLLIPDHGDWLYDYIKDKEFKMLKNDLIEGYPLSMYDEIEMYVKTVEQLYSLKNFDELPALIDQCNKLFEKIDVSYRLSVENN